MTEGRKGVFQRELPAFPWEPAGLAQSGLFSAPAGNAARQEGGPGAPSPLHVWLSFRGAL